MAGRRGRGGQGQLDTAKDIILGTAPSGLGPRKPREGVASPNRNNGRTPPGGVSSYDDDRNKRGRSPQPQRAVQPVQPIVQPYNPNHGGDMHGEISKLQAQLAAYQRAQQDLLQSEAAARRRLEDQIRSNQDALNRMGGEVRQHGQQTGQGVSKNDLEDIRRRFAGLEGTVLRMQQDIVHLKAMVDRHSSDLMTLNGEVKSRPPPDNSKNVNISAQMDGRLRDVHGQLMATRQALDQEIGERRKGDLEANEIIKRLQQMLADQDQRKNQILHDLARKGDMDNAKLSEEARRLNDKIEYITNEVTRNMQDQNNKMRDEFAGKYQSLEKAIKGEMAQRNEYEQKLRALLDDRWRAYSNEIDELKKYVETDRGKNKEKFQKINEALAILERHLEHGNKKIDRVVEAEIKTRKLHEKGLLSKMSEVEDRLSTYLNGMNTAVDDARRGKREVHIPTIDFDGVRRDMEAIASDKSKMTMEGLLKLEEKMRRIENGLGRDSKDLTKQMNVAIASNDNMDADTLARLRQQLKRMDEMQEDIEKSHSKLRDKVERQIPEDLDELAQKLENSRRQLHERVDREENERYLAVRELQEEISKLKRNPGSGAPVAVHHAQPNRPAPPDPQLQREVEEQKIAIKKLAESITTVRNVLDRKLAEESRSRENAISKLQGAR